jgi:hypothetical protein
MRTKIKRYLRALKKIEQQKENEKQQELVRLADKAQLRIEEEAKKAEAKMLEEAKKEKKTPKNALKELKKEEVTLPEPEKTEEKVNE